MWEQATDEQSSWLQHLRQAAQGQAESLGAHLKVSYISYAIMTLLIVSSTVRSND